MSGRRYGEPRQRAQLELRAAAAQFIVEAELLLRWLDELGEPAAAHALEERHAEVLGRARSLEAALNHVVSLELLASEGPVDTPPPMPNSSHVRADAEAKTRRTIPIIGDPDKPKPEPESAHPSPTPGHDDSEDTDGPIPAPQPFDSA